MWWAECGTGRIDRYICCTTVRLTRSRTRTYAPSPSGAPTATFTILNLWPLLLVRFVTTKRSVHCAAGVTANVRSTTTETFRRSLASKASKRCGAHSQPSTHSYLVVALLQDFGCILTRLSDSRIRIYRMPGTFIQDTLYSV